MRQAHGRHLSFQLRKRKSRRIPPVIIADDISQEITQAQEMLKQVEISAAKVKLRINAEKKVQFNQESSRN